VGSLNHAPPKLWKPRRSRFLIELSYAKKMTYGSQKNRTAQRPPPLVSAIRETSLTVYHGSFLENHTWITKYLLPMNSATGIIEPFM